MNTEDLAIVFEGITGGLGAALKEKDRKELGALAGMFRRFPSQSITEFIKFVDASFSKEKNSVPAMVERIRAFEQGRGEPVEELQGSLAKVGAPDLKKVVTALGMKAAGKKDENVRLLESRFLRGSGSQASSAAGQGDGAADSRHEIEAAYAEYEAIKSALKDISVPEMRGRFAALSGRPKPVLVGVLAKLGYPADGSREDLAAKLLDNLTSLKISFDQTRQIGS
jgi:hypothetical protein